MGNRNSIDNEFKNNLRRHFRIKPKSKPNEKNEQLFSVNSQNNKNNKSNRKYSKTKPEITYNESLNSIPNIEPIPIRRIQLSLFKSYGDRIIACNGDCGSQLSLIIDNCVHEKDLDNIKVLDDVIAIEDAFWLYGSPTRDLLIHLMMKKRINEESPFYEELYDKLTNKHCKINGEEWIIKIKSLLLQLSFDGHIDVLEKLANHSCLITNISLTQEIAAYHRREKTKQRINKKELDKKIKRILQCKEYEYMKQRKQLSLSDLEILSIILYCDYNIFAYKMRKSHREEHINSCHWKKLFCHLYSAVYKIHRALHLKNEEFYTYYVKNRAFRRNKLFHGLYNVSLSSDYIQNLSLQTITSFTDQFGVAKSFTYNKGMILCINDAFRLIYNGELPAANVSWISRHIGEREWIVLPVQFKSICKITKDNEEYFHCIYNTDTVGIYEAHILKTSCNVDECKKLKSIINTLYWYYQQRRISYHDNMVMQYIQNKEKGYQQLGFNCRHLLEEHYNEILSGILTKNKYRMVNTRARPLNFSGRVNISGDEIERIMDHLGAFLKSFDIVNGEKKDNEYMNAHIVQRIDDVLPTHGIYPVICDVLNEFAKYVLALDSLAKDLQKSLQRSDLPFEIDYWILPHRIGFTNGTKLQSTKHANMRLFDHVLLETESNAVNGDEDAFVEDEKVEKVEDFVQSDLIEDCLEFRTVYTNMII